MRLQKALARAGVASRRASERLIRQGHVRVNGHVVTELGTQVDPEHDVIQVAGRQVQIARQRRYVKLHKPSGYLSVMHDQRGRPCAGDLVPNAQGLHLVGRLDLDSEGLILLTDDGALTLRMTHPRYEHPKEYLVLVRGVPSERALAVLRHGVELEDGRTAPAQVDHAPQSLRPQSMQAQNSRLYEALLGQRRRGQTWLRIVLHEGRKRQIRRMCAAVGHPVERLVRIRMGPIELGDLAAGASTPLTSAEIHRLEMDVGLAPR